MIPFSKTKTQRVANETMQEIYDLLKTPYKIGPVMKISGKLCDSPTVFRYDNRWYMSFIQIDSNTGESGYDSHLAVSDDLVRWEYLFPTLQRNDTQSWDSKQVAAYAGFVENDFYGEYKIKKVNGKYHFAYLGGNLNGYETDPLFMGQAQVSDILNPKTYVKKENPILSPLDQDVREGENLTLYKANMFEDEKQTLGYPYVNIYNAKGPNHKESIFIAVSNDGENWLRYGEKSIISDESVRINGDPQVLKVGELYVMLYFIYNDGKAFNTFACSYDLVNWTKWQGEPLIKAEEEWENVYAHKPWVVVENGIVYHYYCACNSKGERFIALATSEKTTQEKCK